MGACVGSKLARSGGIVVIAVISVLLSSCLPINVATLASDDFEGRDNNTDGGLAARDFLVTQLQGFADGLLPGETGASSYVQPFAGGANVLAVIPGTDLADEYVLVGAHYDHLGSDCDVVASDGDTICNGATDNAAGVAIVLEIGRAIAASDTAPRRSIILAMWDREEDGLLGSTHFVENPIVPLASITSYVNYDIQGSNLLPSLRDTTLAIGTETGGAALGTLVDRAGADGPLALERLSALFGQLRSDYAVFIGRSVPTVFFTDSTGPCYHTTKDDFQAVDLAKTIRQAQLGTRVVADLASRAQTLSFEGGNPAATHADARVMASLLDRAQADLGRFTPQQQSQLLSFQTTVDQIVAEGPAAFGADDINTLISGSATVVSILSTGQCESFVG